MPGSYELSLSCSNCGSRGGSSQSCHLPPKLRVGGRAKNVSNSANNIRNRASTGGGIVGQFPRGGVAEVLDGPVRANGYNWFKIRYSGVTGWTAEGANCRYWLVNTTDRVSSGSPSSPGGSDLGGTANIRYGQTRTGSLNDRNYFDDYVFSASAGDVVTISMDKTSGNLDPMLRLYNSSGRELAENDDGGSGRNALISRYRISSGGRYFIHALRYEAGESGGYRLRLTRSSTSRPTATRRPTSTPQPRSISYGQSRNGNISGSETYDLYEFDAKAGDRVTIAMDRVTGTLDPVLWLFGPSGFLVADGDSGRENSARISDFRISSSGKYRFRAGRSGGSGNYRLTMSLANPTATPTPRPTSTPRPTATPTDTPTPQHIQIHYGQEYIGRLNASDDYITHQFTASAGDIVTIRLDGEENLLDLAFDLWDSSGVKVASADGSGYGAGMAILDHKLESGGDYFVSVIRQGGAGQYWLDVMLQEAKGDNIKPQVSQPEGGNADLQTQYIGDRADPGIDGIDSKQLVDTFEIQPADGLTTLSSAVKVCFPTGMTNQIQERGYLMFLDESRTPPKLGALISWREGGNLCAAVDKPGTILRMNHNSEAAFNQWVATLKSTLIRNGVTLAAKKTVKAFTEALIDVVGGQLAKKAGDAASPAFEQMKKKIIKKLGADSFNSLSKGSLNKLYRQAADGLVTRFRNSARLNLATKHYANIYQANYDEIVKTLSPAEAISISTQIADASIEIMTEQATQEYQEALLNKALDEIAERAGEAAEEAGEEAFNQTVLKFIFEDDSDGGTLGDLVADQTEAIVGETASSVAGFLTDLGAAVALGIYSPLKSAAELVFHSITGILAELGVTSWPVGADCRATANAEAQLFHTPNGIPIDTIPQNASLAVSRRTPSWFLARFTGGAQFWLKADAVSTSGAC